MDNLLRRLSIGVKLGLLSGLLLAVAVTLGLTAILLTKQIGAEIEEIAEGDLPMIRILTELEATQLEQAIRFERALRHAEEVVMGRNFGGHNAAEQFDEAVAEFTHLGSRAVEEYHRAEEIIATGIEHAASAETAAHYEEFRVELKEFEEIHESYQEHAEAVFNLFEQGRAEAALERSDAIEEEEEAADNKIEHLLTAVEDRTEESALMTLYRKPGGSLHLPRLSYSGQGTRHLELATAGEFGRLCCGDSTRRGLPEKSSEMDYV